MKSNRILRIGLAVLAVLIVLCVAGVLVVRSRAFHAYLLDVVITHAEKSLGTRVDIGDFTLRLSALRVDLYRIAIHGTEPDSQKPLLWADHLAVALNAATLSRRGLKLQEIIVDHPMVHLSINREGHNNLPAIPPTPSGEKPTNVFDLAIGHVALNQGEIYYNDRETPMRAELRDVHAQAEFDPVRTQYNGTLSYRRGLIHYGDYNPLQHDLEAQMTASPSALTLKSLRLAAGSSRITAQAELQNYSNPVLDGSYDLLVNTDDFRQILRNNSLPAGEVSTQGTIHYQSQIGQSLLDSLVVQGELSSPALAVSTPQARASVQTLRVDYGLSRGNLAVRQMQADVLGGHVTGQFTMQHLAGDQVAHLEAKLTGLSFADATAALATKPPVRVTGRLDGTVAAGWRGSIDDLQATADATIAAATRVAATPGAASNEVPLDGAVHLAYNGTNGVLTLRQTSLHTPHTTLSLQGTVSNSSSLAVHAHTDDLGEIDRLLLTLRTVQPSKGTSQPQPPQLLGLGGVAALDCQVAGNMRNPRVTGYVSGANLRYQKTRVPGLKANVELSSSGAALHQGQVQIGPQGRVQFDAAVGLKNWSYTPQSPVTLQMTANKVPVTDLEHLANLPYPASGDLSANVSAQGTGRQVRVTGNLSGANLRYQETSVPILRTSIDLDPSGLALHQGQLRIGAQGRVQFDAAVGLNNWSYTPQNAINLRMTASEVSTEDVQRLADLHYPVSGDLSADMSLQGSQANLTGHGLVRLEHANAWGEPIHDLSLNLQAANDAIHSTLNVSTSAGSGTVALDYSPKDEAYKVHVDFPGIHLDQLQPVKERGLEVSGVLKVSGQGQGTIKDPQLDATVEAPALQIEQQKLDGLKIQAGVAHQQATFSLDSSVGGAYIRAQGTVNLTSNYEANVNIDTRAIQLGPLLATYFSVPDLRGQTELHASLKGPLRKPGQLEGQVSIPTLSLSYQSVQIANASPIRVDYKGQTATLQPVEIKGTETDLRLQGTARLGNGKEGNLKATANGNVDLHLIQVLNSQWSSSGQLKLNLNAEGAPTSPALQGQVRLIDATVLPPSAPLGAEKVNAEFDLQNGRVDIKSFSGESGGGTVTARGFATYAPALRFDVSLAAEHVRLRYPEGVRAVLKSDLNLVGTTESATLNGQVLVDRLSFTPDFDLTTFAGQFSGNSAPPSAGFVQNVKLNVALKSAQEMSLASSQVSVQGSANLRVVGTLADPVILGRTEITGGELFFNGLRFQVQHGTIQFANPVTTQPVLNVLVTTTVQQFNISVNLVGPIDRLRTSYTSDPPLATVDIISLLFTGQTSEASAANPSTPQSVVAGQVAGQVSSRLGKLAGISSLTIDPQIGGNQSNPGASLGIQQRVTKNLFFTFTTDLTTTQGDIVQVEYQITKKYAVSAVATQNQGYSLEVKMHRKF